MKAIGLQIVSFVLILGLTLSSMAAREVVSGTVDKVDAVKGLLVLKTAPALRLFEIRSPEKLLSLKPGDLVQLTIHEDGTVVVEQKSEKK
jgi:hypothetical protein